MPVLILFDIDGTLLLTGGAGGRAMTRAFEDVFGIPDALRDVPTPGRTDPRIVDDAMARAGLQGDEALLERFPSRYLVYLREEIEVPGTRIKGLLPGVRPLLDALAASPGVHLALLTGNFTEAARIKLEYFDLWHYFACGAFGEEGITRNDLMPVALDRARGCDMPPAALERVVVIGDTPSDVACARSGNAFAIAVATGAHSVDELRACGADVVFETLSETPRVLEAIDGAYAGR
jgi:phosphoglycolate phosphatase-like HAD superfamily hydrolase